MCTCLFLECQYSSISFFLFFPYAPPNDRNMNQWSLFIIENILIRLLSADMCSAADIITRCLVFSLGERKTRLWLQVGRFLHTKARHLHQSSINLSSRHFGPGTNSIWDRRGHIYGRG